MPALGKPKLPMTPYGGGNSPNIAIQRSDVNKNHNFERMSYNWRRIALAC
jgi:hypothetical protein